MRDTPAKARRGGVCFVQVDGVVVTNQIGKGLNIVGRDLLGNRVRIAYLNWGQGNASSTWLMPVR